MNNTAKVIHGVTKGKLEELALETAPLMMKLIVKDGLVYFLSHRGDSHFHCLALRS